MARFTVVWESEVEAALADIWNNANDKQAVADAADAIERELRNDPGAKGRAIAEGLRPLVSPPLRVLFSASDLDRKALVVAVRRTEP